jgi:hypothetical protein
MASWSQRVFENELKSAQARYDLMCSSSLGKKLKEGDNWAMASHKLHA